MLDMWVILLLPCYFAKRRADRASLRLNTHGVRRYLATLDTRLCARLCARPLRGLCAYAERDTFIVIVAPLNA